MREVREVYRTMPREATLPEHHSMTTQGSQIVCSDPLMVSQGSSEHQKDVTDDRPYVTCIANKPPAALYDHFPQPGTTTGAVGCVVVHALKL